VPKAWKKLFLSISVAPVVRGGLRRHPVKIDHARTGRIIKKVVAFHWRSKVDRQFGFERHAFPISRNGFGGKRAFVSVNTFNDADVVTIAVAVEIKALDKGTNL